MIYRKRIFFFLCFLLFTFSCNSENKENIENNKDKIPDLLVSDPNGEKKIIYTEDLNDSLKVFFQVVVDFEYPLKDTTKQIIVQNVRTLLMSVSSLTTGENIIDYSYRDGTGTDYQKYIWNLCTNKFNYWYRHQPYEILMEKNMWENQVTFGGIIYLKPRE
ncbi:MAG: hypothetical protein LUG18_01295 [Candidatus Azobacteroides sp.]|nr:hypothetical protein [Candidatus Azobacteroides sp.]